MGNCLSQPWLEKETNLILNGRGGPCPWEGTIKAAVNQAWGERVEVCGCRVETKREMIFLDPTGLAYFLYVPGEWEHGKAVWLSPL